MLIDLHKADVEDDGRFHSGRAGDKNLNRRVRIDIFEYGKRHVNGAFRSDWEITHDFAAGYQDQIDHLGRRISGTEVNGLGALVAGDAIDRPWLKRSGFIEAEPFPCEQPLDECGFFYHMIPFSMRTAQTLNSGMREMGSSAGLV